MKTQINSTIYITYIMKNPRIIFVCARSEISHTRRLLLRLSIRRFELFSANLAVIRLPSLLDQIPLPILLFTMQIVFHFVPATLVLLDRCTLHLLLLLQEWRWLLHSRLYYYVIVHGHLAWTWFCLAIVAFVLLLHFLNG